MKLFFTIFLLLALRLSYAQENKVPVLEREISISTNNQSLENVLNNISYQGDFVFSYSPKAINHLRNVSINIDHKPVRYALNQLFKDENIDYKVKGKYVILKKKSKKAFDDTQILEGYVFDSQTGSRLNEASVYDKTLLASAVTDKYGYFSMQVPANTPIKSLQISKLGYSDTLLITLDSASRYRNMEISLTQDDSVKSKPIIDFKKLNTGWLIPDKLKINARNITDPVFRTVQFSLIPTVSTNKFLGGSAINQISINLTVGYVQEIRKFEAGVLLNFVRTNVRYFQAAGLGNVVGGDLEGFQAAGIFNIVKDVTGFQAAGIFNNSKSIEGTQAAGIFNLTADTASIQMAGIFNTATKNEVQIAGMINNSTESAAQIAGLLNVTKDANFQIAGLLNAAGNLSNGAQIAGLLNSSKTNSQFQLAGAINDTKGNAGTQISGLMNSAGHLQGFQLAPFNFADTSSGFSLGILSFIKKGYHKVEISADETFPLNLAFRTGTKGFHTFITGGTSSVKFDNFLWNIGYGIGTSVGNPSKLLLDLDFSSHEVTFNNNFNGNYHWYKIYLGLDKKITKKMSIAAGVSYNALLSDSDKPDYHEIDSRMPNYTLTETNYSNGHNLKTWIGGKIGLRFF